MRIMEDKLSDDCVGSGYIKDYRLDGKTTRALLAHLAAFGELHVIEGLKKPFYTVNVPHLLQVKGIMGEDSIKVVYHPGTMEEASIFLGKILGCFPADAGRLRELESEYVRIVAGLKV